MLQQVFVIIFVHHTLSWCQTSGKNSGNRRENLTVIELTRKQQQQQCR